MDKTKNKIDENIEKLLGPYLRFHRISLQKTKRDRGIYDMEMEFTPGIKWKMIRTKNQLIFTPDYKLKGIKDIHYTFPLPLGIWMHKTVTWENGKKEHSKISMLTRKFDFAKDFLKYKDKYGSV